MGEEADVPLCGDSASGDGTGTDLCSASVEVPDFFEVLGWLSIVAAIVILVSGRERTGRLLDWFERVPAWAVRLWCLVGVFFGAFLIYGVS